MESASLDDIYSSVNKDARIIYVVPLIRYSYKKSDYGYLLYKKLIEGDKYDVRSISILNHFKLVSGGLFNRNVILHYHWLEFQDVRALMGMPWKMLCIYLFRLLGGNIVWTLHNEFPHDQRYLKLHRYLHKKMADWADALHVHCHKAISIMSRRLESPPEKFHIVPHPEFPPSPIPAEEARQHLLKQYSCNLSGDSSTLLMFGNISRYKQIEKVAEMVIGLKHECKLLIVGPVKKGNMDLYRQLERLQKQSERLIMIPHFIPEAHVSWFFSASDICVFNYRNILSSGGYNMAKAYGKTVIAPDIGCLSEEHTKSNVHLFIDQKELKSLLIKHTKSN